MTAERVVVSGESTDPASTFTALGLRTDSTDPGSATDSGGEYPVTYGCPAWAVASREPA